MADFGPELRRTLREAGCWKDRQGKGHHEIWISPHGKRPFVVDGKIKSRPDE